ncbi:MAG: PilN domain-containing protein [Aquincola sp.]|nr:PilN domain-containing protein [Aquincola sp.]
MPRVNLLPWREQERKERKLAFLVALGGAAIAATLMTVAVNLYYGSLINSQEDRNLLLQSEIKELDKQIEKINTLEQQKQNFIARMEIIEKLQRSRPEVVHLFDELVRTVPDGTYLTAVTQTGNRLKIEGVAQSSTRVSSFMRNIDGSDWLRKPELEVIETKQGQTLGASFTLFAEQVSQLAEDEAAAAAAEASANTSKGKSKTKKPRREASAAKAGKTGGAS